jgi:hypothetical protein
VSRVSSPTAAAAAAASRTWLWLRGSAHGRDPGEAAFVLWCHRNAFAPRPQDPSRTTTAGAAGSGAAARGLPELQGSLFAEQFSSFVRAADGVGSAAVLARMPGPGRGPQTGVALLVRGHVRQPGLRVHAPRIFADAVLAPPPDPAATPPLLAGRYVVDGEADAVPDELVVELLDPTLPPLVIECLPRGLLVGTATSRLQAAQIDALAAVTARLRLLLLDDVATAARWR